MAMVWGSKPNGYCDLTVQAIFIIMLYIDRARSRFMSLVTAFSVQFVRPILPFYFKLIFFLGDNPQGLGNASGKRRVKMALKIFLL